MLSKFETKVSNRVKGLTFHPKRPWILASLHNGSVQLWDYKIGSLIDRFDEHEGPVRGVSFHPTQPLFVSGGDDYKIKVWNWRQRRCLFTLNGHLDYIRTVFFHHEHPWIISCSDDQTIRIWNWQSRNCISILTGHNHYVMCAQFHPKEDLVVSASLDQTVRIWDISGLRKKHASPQTAAFDHDSRHGHGQPDIFGGTDAIVKFVLEGHDRGVNWAAFHPNLPMIVSGADDRQVKLWRMNETRAWELDTFRGHYNNVSCVVFHPRQELIISNSEDKTISIWDMSKRTRLQTFRQEHDRFWILTAHPDLNLFAAGHDSGFIVFKLERERPAQAIHQNHLFYVKDKYLRLYDYTSANDVPLVIVRRGAVGQSAPPRTLSYNPAEHSVIICSSQDGGTYELFNLPREMSGEVREVTSSEGRKGAGQAAVFVGRNRFAVLDKSTQQILIKDLQNATTKQFKTPAVVVDIFYAGSKNLLLITATSVILFDIELRTTVAELSVSGVRYAVWSADMSMVALLSKNTIAIATKQLEQTCLIHETMKIKSGAWDDIGIFMYSTQNHIKYALTQGDNGIIRTVDQPIYLTKVKGKSLFCLDRDGKVRIISIDPTEYRFKLALVKKNYDEVLPIIRNSNLVGQSIIAYLQKKGYPEVALHFVKDVKTRFELAIECGNMEVAVEMAKAMDREDCWNLLAAEALRQGNHQIVEMAYKRVKNFDRLSFLYLITGNIENLKKMMQVAERRGDNMSRYHNALYLGDIDEQVRLLKDVGQSSLAYLAAKTYGLEEEAAIIFSASGLESPPSIPDSKSELLKLSTPILKQFGSNWPLLAVSRGFFEGGIQSNSIVAAQVPMDGGDDEEGAGWAEEDGMEAEVPTLGAETRHEGDGEEEGWEEEMEIPPEDLKQIVRSSGTQFVAPIHGTSVNELWARNSLLAADHVAAGSFETAMELLNRQVGISNFTPLRSIFLSIFQSTKAYIAANPSVPSLAVPISRFSEEKRDDKKKLLPFQSVSFTSIIAKLQDAYGIFTRGGFTNALTLFTSILHLALFIVVSKSSELEEVRQLISTAREYIIGVKMQLLRKGSEAKRSLELAAYFTHCRLQTPHLIITLNAAMTAAINARNYINASQFARRLLELGPSPDKAQKARQALDVCERNQSNEFNLAYDQHNPFVVCCKTFTPIYHGSPKVSCSYCGAAYLTEFEKQICVICEVAAIGAPATGLRCMIDQR